MSQRKRVGVDEAGRGCVLGPLVVAAIAATEADCRAFRRWNVRDSKRIPAEERTLLAQKIADRCWHALCVAAPQEIDAAVANRSRTLNGLERELMAALLCHAREVHQTTPLCATIDAPSINATRFQTELCAASGWTDRELTACHHADEEDIAVSAASIIAKHHRERLLAETKATLNTDFGSGYSHDPKTIAHIKTAPEGAAYVRWSWATTQRVRSRPSL